MLSKTQATVLLTSLFMLSACAILYELLISTVSSYLLGSSVLHFSITIGLFLSFLGLGAYLSKWIQGNLLAAFVGIEIALGLVGGISVLILYLGNEFFENYYILLVLVTAATGILAGMEIPLVTRILEDVGDLKDIIARVLAFDYLGALAASLLFPLLLLPMLGNMRTAFFTGLVNWAVAIFNLFFFKKALEDKTALKVSAGIVGTVLLMGFVYSFQLVSFADNLNYQDKIIHTEQSPYQRIVLTKWKDDIRLHLNGNLQFSSVDEYRYHEPLVHISALAAGSLDSVLVLGGGDGLVCRELLNYPSIRHIDLVDLDPQMTDLAQHNPHLSKLNQHSLSHSTVQIWNEDAFVFVQNSQRHYNLILIDLPDPSTPELGKLYSHQFYTNIKRRLTADGVLTSQASSPFFARAAYWCVGNTMQEVFDTTVAFHSYVPAFGDWGFQMALQMPFSQTRIQKRLATLPDLRFLKKENLPSLFIFDADTERIETPINTLDRMVLVDLYLKSYSDFQ